MSGFSLIWITNSHELKIFELWWIMGKQKTPGWKLMLWLDKIDSLGSLGSHFPDFVRFHPHTYARTEQSLPPLRERKKFSHLWEKISAEVRLIYAEQISLSNFIILLKKNRHRGRLNNSRKTFLNQWEYMDFSKLNNLK